MELYIPVTISIMCETLIPINHTFPPVCCSFRSVFSARTISLRYARFKPKAFLIVSRAKPLSAEPCIHESEAISGSRNASIGSSISTLSSDWNLQTLAWRGKSVYISKVSCSAKLLCSTFGCLDTRLYLKLSLVNILQSATFAESANLLPP